MTKRNAQALQRKYTKLLARATALTLVVRHLGQGVTGRPPWSLGLGMLGLIVSTERASCAKNDSLQVPGCRATCKAEVVGSDPFRQLWGINTPALILLATGLDFSEAAPRGGLNRWRWGLPYARRARTFE